MLSEYYEDVFDRIYSKKNILKKIDLTMSVFK